VVRRESIVPGNRDPGWRRVFAGQLKYSGRFRQSVCAKAAVRRSGIGKMLKEEAVLQPLDVLYLGSSSGTSLDRASALRRLGHAVDIIDLRSFLPRRFKLRTLFEKAVHELGARFYQPYLTSHLRRAVGGRRYDVVWVDSGELVSRKLVAELRAAVAPVIVNYNVDDPFGLRDRNRWRCYRDSVAEYDLLAVVREENVCEARALGARQVIRVYRSADEVSHAPVVMNEQEHTKWASEVLFVGTWMPGRGQFMAQLLALGVPLTIYGDRWDRSPEWAILKQACRGPAIYQLQYAMAIQAAKINLGLLSKGNRDLHTTRSLEIPALGGLFCAERSTEHQALYKENEEAVFWSSAEECAERCKWLLRDDAARARIRRAGQIRCIENRNFNQSTMQGILHAALFQGIDRDGKGVRPAMAGFLK